MDSKPQLLVQPGAGTWTEGGKFNTKQFFCGKAQCYTGPCVCVNQGTGIISCLISVFIFPFSFILGTLLGAYNWCMCNACLEFNKDKIKFQDDRYRMVCPCGCNYMKQDGVCDIGEFLCGTCICKMGPCLCLTSGTGFGSCLCAGCFFPFACIIGAIIGIFNWLTCGSCAPYLDESDVQDLIHV